MRKYIIYKHTSPSGKVYIGQTCKKPIFCVENDTIYASVYDAAKELNLQFGNIWSVCNGRRKTTGGYHFKYNAA